MRTAFVALSLLALPGIAADPTTSKLSIGFTDSSAAALAGTKRAAITSVLVSFQASVGGDKTNTSGLFAAKTDASTTLLMPEMDPKLLAAITDDIYTQLQADLVENGFEVLPEATVLTSPTYLKIQKLAGITNFSKYGNLNGDVLLVGPSSLRPYLPYNPEIGKFSIPAKRLIKGWVTMTGSSSTEGGPTFTSTGGCYELPGLEVALAKELNAHLVKATYVVTLGSTKSAVDRFSSTHHNTYTGKAFVQVGLRGEQSRIAFRSPNASTKGESVSRGIAANFGEKSPAAKDGDVVVTLLQPLAGGTDFFSLAEPSTKGKGFWGLGGGADAQFIFTASIADPAAYRTEVVGMVKAAQQGMLNLVKR